jgi:hypothetical protein
MPAIPPVKPINKYTRVMELVGELRVLIGPCDVAIDTNGPDMFRISVSNFPKRTASANCSEPIEGLQVAYGGKYLCKACADSDSL